MEIWFDGQVDKLEHGMERAVHLVAEVITLREFRVSGACLGIPLRDVPLEDGA